MKIVTFCVGMLGLLLAIGLITYQGVGTVVQALTAAGWALIFIVLFHLVPLVLDALA